MKFHAIAGLPRSGSTLFCDTLNQNPAFHASSTSFLPSIISSALNVISTTEEFKTYEINDREESERKITDALKGIVEGWYGNVRSKVVFDKARGWGHNVLTLNKLYPDAKMLVLVRDLRGVLASIEKAHQAFPMLDMATDHVSKTLFQRASNVFSTDGVVGLPLNGIEDLIRRSNSSVLFVRFEDFIHNPKLTIDTVYDFIGEEKFEHNFDDVPGTAIDVDGLYHNKFPHKRSGGVDPVIDDWKQYVPKDVAKEIMNRFPLYNDTFEYA